MSFAMDIHPDTRRLADALSAVQRGEIITLDEISEVVDRNIRACRYLFYGAQKIAQRESGAVFATERGMGYRRLTTEEIHTLGQTARARIRGTSRRAVKSITQGIAGSNDIDPVVHRKILSEQSVLGLLEHIARDKNLPPISEKETRPLSVAVTAKAFLRSIGSIAA